MKTLLKKTAALVLITFISFPALAGKAARDTSLCLEITGKAIHHDFVLDEVVVILVQDNKEISKIVLKEKEKFKFTLKRNTHYTIKLYRKGFVGRSMSIDTHLPSTVE